MLEALGSLGDFIGGLAVIATLLYLAIQVRQNTQLLRANTLAATAAATVSFNHMLGSDPAVARVFQVGLENLAASRRKSSVSSSTFYGPHSSLRSTSSTSTSEA